MPHFHIISDESGSVVRIERDGKNIRGPLQLEQAFSVSSFYFKAAAVNLDNLVRPENLELREQYGVQAFLLSLTGVEAFLNTCYLLRAQESGNQELVSAVNSKSGKLQDRLKEFVRLSGDAPLQDLQQITDRLSKLSIFRHSLVHPRWVPSSLDMSGGLSMSFGGLVENARLPVKDHLFCVEAFWWCIYAVALVGVSRGSVPLDGFLFHWTGLFNIDMKSVRAKLAIE